MGFGLFADRQHFAEISWNLRLYEDDELIYTELLKKKIKANRRNICGIILKTSIPLMAGIFYSVLINSNVSKSWQYFILILKRKLSWNLHNRYEGVTAKRPLVPHNVAKLHFKIIYSHKVANFPCALTNISWNLNHEVCSCEWIKECERVMVNFAMQASRSNCGLLIKIDGNIMKLHTSVFRFAVWSKPSFSLFLRDDLFSVLLLAACDSSLTSQEYPPNAFNKNVLKFSL